jgi:uncharacterized coiled-coil protein SlyX
MSIPAMLFAPPSGKKMWARLRRVVTEVRTIRKMNENLRMLLKLFRDSRNHNQRNGQL